MRRVFFVLLALLGIGLAAPWLIAQPPPGQVRPRPAEGREPELKAPTIREYKPKSMLVAPAHPVPRAKFPVNLAFWKLYGIGLPDPVLKKLYYQNALKVTPGLPRAAFGS